MGYTNKSNKQRLAVTIKKSTDATVLENRAIRLEFVGSQELSRSIHVVKWHTLPTVVHSVDYGENSVLCSIN